MDFDRLLRSVRGDTPLDRISSAMGVKRDLDELTDALIDHVVQEARDAGHSWSEIGAAMGVTKQAAQQRHRPEKRSGGRRMLDGALTRFDADAKAAVAAAHAAAQLLGHGQVGTEHLLVGVLDTSSAAADALAELGIERGAILRSIEPSDGRRRRHLPFTRNAKKVLELAMRDAIAAGAATVGCEHIVLGILRADDSAAAKLLAAHGVTRAAFESKAVA